LDVNVNVKVIPQQAEVAQGVPGRLRPRIFLTFGTTWVVGRQPYAPAAFTPGEIRYSFSEAESTRGHVVPSGATEKIPSNTTGNRSRDLRLVAQCLNYYATPGPPNWDVVYKKTSITLLIR